MNRRSFFGLIGGALVVAKTDGLEKLLEPPKTTLRKLKCSYSLEAVEDLRNWHGLDAEVELENIIRQEIAFEIGREKGLIKDYPDYPWEELHKLEQYVDWSKVYSVDAINPDKFIKERTFYYEV